MSVDTDLSTSADPSTMTATAVVVDSPSDAWDSSLRTLEDDVARLEHALRFDPLSPDFVTLATAEWVPPLELGQLPEQFRQRASALLDRQLAAAQALVEQITMSHRQRDVVARLSASVERPTPAFFDQAL